MPHPKYKETGKITTRTIEECSELIKEICKAERFGWFNFHPNNPKYTNIDSVLDEIEDVENCCNELKILLEKLK